MSSLYTQLLCLFVVFVSHVIPPLDDSFPPFSPLPEIWKANPVWWVLRWVLWLVLGAIIKVVIKVSIKVSIMVCIKFSIKVVIKVSIKVSIY